VAIIRVNPNLEAELTGAANANGPLEHSLGLIANSIAAEARRIGYAEFYDRGGYVRGIKATHGVNDQGELVGRVVATDWKSHWAERGWKRRVGGERPRRILERAAQRVGYRVMAAEVLGASGRPAGGQSALPSGARRAITGR
jgi:hypothetical protein